MIGDYFYNHIQLTYGYAGNGTYGWSAKAVFLDAGFANDDPANDSISTEGELRTRYCIRDTEGKLGVRVATETLIRDLTTLGISPMPGLVVIQVTNLEDEEIQYEKCSAFYTDIPEEDLAEVYMLGTEYDFDVTGIRKSSDLV